MSEDVGGASFLSGSVWYSDPTLRATSQRACQARGFHAGRGEGRGKGMQECRASSFPIGFFASLLRQSDPE